MFDDHRWLSKGTMGKVDLEAIWIFNQWPLQQHWVGWMTPRWLDWWTQNRIWERTYVLSLRRLAEFWSMCELSALIYLATTGRGHCVLVAITLSQSESSISATRCHPMSYGKGYKSGSHRHSTQKSAGHQGGNILEKKLLPFWKMSDGKHLKPIWGIWLDNLSQELLDPM